MNTDGPAFPFPAYTYPNGELNHGEGGMTLREYAAIHLKVPNSGTVWLDVMIEDANKLAREMLTIHDQSNTL